MFITGLNACLSCVQLLWENAGTDVSTGSLTPVSREFTPGVLTAISEALRATRTLDNIIIIKTIRVRTYISSLTC